MFQVNKDLICKMLVINSILINLPSEHVWTLLGKAESILKALWPVTPEFDRVLISAGSYLDQCAHDFRLRLKTYLAALSSKSGKKTQTSVAVEKPTHGTIWIAKTYPTWQSIILTLLQEKFQASYSKEKL